ncbi:MAG TPA: hypothetical protein VH722_07615 [Alphaproteobacteria bacterium]|jgi:hypothetical protein|nr:hypothetical protein [Alphaproteobacteria bacterium]
MVFPFERLRDRLLIAGVSPRHVRRYMAELADHFDDLEAAAKSAGNPRPRESAMERLGRPEDLARAMIDRPELKAWTARAPWAVFLLGPPLLLAVIDFLSIVLMIALVKTLGPQPGEAAPGWEVTLAATINLLQIYVVPLLLGWIVSVVATRQRIRPLWPLIGLIVIGIVAGINYLHIEVPLAPGQHGEISFGGSIGHDTAFRVAINLALTLPLYLAWRRRQPVFVR